MAVTINGTTGIVTPDIGVDGSTLVVDSVNNRIGIGISSPGTPLDVAGIIQSDTGLQVAGHPVVGYATITGGYAARLGSTGSTTLNKTQIYARGAHVATFDGATGNVGIGTDSPSSTLQVGLDPNSGNGAGVAAGSNGALKMARTNDADQLIEGYKVGDSSPNFVVRADGKVGINQTSPNAPLSFASATGQKIEFYNSGSNNEFGIGVQSSELRISSGTNSRISFFTNGYSGDERLRITPGGLVQIGTITTSSFPDRLLSVGDHTRTSSYIDIRSGTVGALLFADGLSGDTAYRGQVEYTHSDDRMCFWTAGGERVRITSSGNMGLGTGSPVAKLDVRGNVYVGDSIGVDITNPQDYHASANDIVVKNGMTIANTSQGSIFFADSSTGTGEYVGQINYYHNNNQLSFVTNNTERMRLSGNGEHMVYSNGTVSALRTAASSSGSSEILYCSRNSSSVTVGTGVYAIYSNGTASSLSDRTQKKNIETTRDGYLEDLNRLRVVKYNWNDQEDGTPKELGLIAQEVEEVFPGLISNMRSDVGIGTTASTKGVKTSVLPYMLLKALQEANAEIVALKARVNTLEGS